MMRLSTNREHTELCCLVTVHCRVQERVAEIKERRETKSAAWESDKSLRGLPCSSSVVP